MNAHRWDLVTNVGLVLFATGALVSSPLTMVFGIPFVPAIWIPVAVLTAVGLVASKVGLFMAGRDR